MDLTPIQTEILSVLISLYRKSDRAVKGEEIAGIIDRNPGTIRNQMQSLKALRLVDGVPGPKGGYKPTSSAYEVLSFEVMSKEAVTPIYRNGVLVESATVAEISFTAVRHPDLCNGMVHVMGEVRQFNEGDQIQVGPTPVNKLIIRGHIVGRDDTKNTLIYSISEMVSLPKKKVKEYVKEQSPITINAHSTIQEASRVLVENNIHGAPVTNGGEIIGVVTFTDIGKALANGKTSLKMKDIMSKKLISIDGDTPMYEVVKMFDIHKVSRLIVTTDDVPVGIISKADILHELAVY